MRILLVQGSSTGGVGRHVADVARGVSRAGHTVIVAAPESARAGLEARFGRLEPAPAADGRPGFVPVEIAAEPRPVADRAVVAQLRGLARGADVVHAHGLRAGALAALGMAAVRTPLVVTLHNLPVGSPVTRAVGHGLLGVVARRAAVVLGVSQDLVVAAQKMGARMVGRALVPIPPSSEHDIDDILRVRRDLLPHDDPGAVLVLTVARLAPQKGLDTLIDAAAQVAGDPRVVATGREVSFSVAGEGPLRQALQAQIMTTASPLTLLGARDDVPLLMRAADLVVVPSRWEGQPLVVQEALQAGCAVIATEVGGTGEVAGDAVVLVPPNDATALAAAVAETLTASGRLDVLREASRRRAASLPTQEDLVSQLLGRYTDLARRRG